MKEYILIQWLSLLPPYLAIGAAVFGWIRTKKIRKQVDWNKAATFLSNKINEEEQESS